MITRAGRFITLEGGEGVGKSTQAARLAALLRARGLKVVETREPGGTEGAEAIRQILLNGTAERWSARSEALLFAAARCDHVEKTIAPALASGNWVVCDRYIDSTRAYQGAGGGMVDAEVLTVHALGARLMPDRTVLLTLPPEVALERTRRRDGETSDRIGGKGATFFALVDQRFRLIADEEPERVRVLSAIGGEEEVSALALAAVSDLLPC